MDCINEVVPNDYSKVTETKDIQKLLVYLMEKIHEICEEHNIVYNVFGGTMLGAVRHQGMIPWDDDIDITMPRPDYERFIEIVMNKYQEEFCICAFPDKGYAYPFAKFCSRNTMLVENLKPEFRYGKLYIDVFPVDGYPKLNEDRFFKHLITLKYKRCILVNNSWKRTKGLRNLVKRTIKTTEEKLISFHDAYYYIGKEVSTVKENAFEDSDYVLCQGAGWNQKGKVKKEIYLDRKLYDFEGIKVWGIADYHDHLSRLYGNYMQLPPEEKRVSNHDYDLYVKKGLLDKVLGRTK